MSDVIVVKDPNRNEFKDVVNHPISWSISFISVIFLIVGLMFNNKTLGVVLSIVATILVIVIPYFSVETISKSTTSRDISTDFISVGVNISISFSSTVIMLLLGMGFAKNYYDSEDLI